MTAFLIASALSIANTIDAFGNLGEDPGTSAVAWLVQIAGIGAAAIIGGVTWSRRNEHRRHLQREELTKQSLV